MGSGQTCSNKDQKREGKQTDPFMSKALPKEIMHRSILKNNFNKNSNEENKRLYKRQRNFCVALLKREKIKVLQ